MCYYQYIGLDNKSYKKALKEDREAKSRSETYANKRDNRRSVDIWWQNEDNAARKKLTTLANSSLYFSDPEDFNDPSEVQLRYEINDETGFRQEIQKAIGLFAPPDRFPLNAVINRFKNHTTGSLRSRLLNTHFPEGSSARICFEAEESLGISCLSKKRDDFLMWSHYASGHTGFCVGLAFPKNLRHDYSLEEVKYKCRMPAPIKYQGTGFDIKRLYKQVSIKHNDWKYENEFRVISTSRKDQEVGTKISEIILGSRCMLATVLKRHLSEAKVDLDSINLFYVSKLNQDYSLNLSEITWEDVT